MKLTIRIPTVTYGYIEAEFQSLEELKQNYQALKAEAEMDKVYVTPKKQFESPTEVNGVKLLRNKPIHIPDNAREELEELEKDSFRR